MAITSADIQNQSFKIERRSYDVNEVDVFWSVWLLQIDDLNDEIAHLRAQASEASAARTEIISQPEVDMVSRDRLAEKMLRSPSWKLVYASARVTIALLLRL